MPFSRVFIVALIIATMVCSKNHPIIINNFLTRYIWKVLNLTRDATREQISRSYRSLARKWHPDLHRGAEQKAEATIKFQLIAQAYEVLRDDESRKDYDYLLDNPEAYYAHYYRYYRRVYAPKVDVRIVIVVAISLISIYQYYAYNSRYKEAIDYFLTIPKYRIQAKEIAIDEGIWPTMNHTSNGKVRLKQRGSGNKQKLKDELKQEEENCLRKIIEEKMDIKGVYSKPTYKDILWIQLFLLPWFLSITNYNLSLGIATYFSFDLLQYNTFYGTQDGFTNSTLEKSHMESKRNII